MGRALLTPSLSNLSWSSIFLVYFGMFAQLENSSFLFCRTMICGRIQMNHSNKSSFMLYENLCFKCGQQRAFHLVHDPGQTLPLFVQLLHKMVLQTIHFLLHWKNMLDVSKLFASQKTKADRKNNQSRLSYIKIIYSFPSKFAYKVSWNWSLEKLMITYTEITYCNIKGSESSQQTVKT